MANIDKNPPGSFCWIELATTDQGAAKNFYTSLFGWDVNEFPLGPSETYTIFQIDGRQAGAAYTMRQEQRAQGVPPNWLLYVTVNSADEAAARVTELGGKVHAGPFDVMELGRMAVIQDPTGAIFALWQPKSHGGIGIAGVPGTLCWADLNTPDGDRAKTFYEALFGWKISVGDKDTSGYLHIQNGETYIGGIPPSQHRNPNAPPHWLIYFYVTDVDAAADKAKQLGANIYLAPMSMEKVGRWSVMADPQGAVFAVFKEQH
jgi:predicted enzyme related to lactoylglutathione lyase